jgi:hypothetical protein
VPTSTLDSDTKKGNEADSKNIGDQSWADELERLKAPDSLEGQGFDDEIERERARLNAATSSSDDGDGSEKQGFWGKLRAGSKRYGPTGGVIGLILGAFGITTVGLAPFSVMTNLTTIVGNHSDMGNRLYHKTSYSFVASFLAGDKRNCAESKIKCKFLTISESRKQQWEKRGIVVDAEKSILPGATGGDRWKVRGLIFPDGTRVENLRAWKTLPYTSPAANSLLKRFPIRASYLNAKSAVTKSLGRYGVTIADRFKSSTAKEKSERKTANSKTMNSKTGAVTDENGKVTLQGISGKDKSESVAEKAKSRFTSASKTLSMAGAASVPAVIACMGYDIIRATQASMMLLWHQELIKFSVPFLQAGSQAKESGVNGGFDWETAEYYGDRLTAPVTQKDIDADPDDNITPDMLGKTAMDSKGMAAALSGDSVINENYSGWAPVNSIWGAGVVKSIQDEVGKENIRTGCTIAGYTMYLGLASCATPQTLIKCIAVAVGYQVVLNIWGDDLLNLVVEQISKPAIETIAKANLSDSLVGPPLGDAVVSAAGILADNMDRASGFPIANTTEQALQAFKDTGNDADYNQIKIAEAKLEASKNQFDASNPYSFAGQLTNQIASIPVNGTALDVLTNIAKTVGAVPAVSRVSAMKGGIYQPIGIYQTPEKFQGAVKNCKSPGLVELQIPCVGESGRTVPLLLPPVDKCVEEESENGDRDCFSEAVDYLFKRTYGDDKKPFVDDNSGEPGDVSEYNKDELDFDNPFLMYMRHCGNDRVYPIGYTDQPLDSENYDWYVGRNCAMGGTGKDFSDLDLAWSSFYYHECIALFASEEGSDYCWTDSLAATTVTGGDWVVPTSGPCLSPYGQRWGKLHAGIDISPPSGTPVVAPTDMTITYSGYNAGGYGNMVTGTAGDGHSFRFGHLLNSDTPAVGTAVKKGQQIGLVGSTGNSTGPHLHFEIFPPGGNPASFSGAVDPVPILAQHGVNISC